jgi:4-hydroxybenzoate polyprenyltransferase
MGGLNAVQGSTVMCWQPQPDLRVRAGAASVHTHTPVAPPAVARPSTPEFWRLYFVEMRPYLMFLSAATGLAGLALAPEFAVPHLIVLTGIFFLAYGFGQALTDCFQTDTDALSAPYRPLARGRLSNRDVLVVSLSGLVIGGGVLVAYNPLNVLLVAAGVAGLATYTWFKRRWWGGPFYNAWIVADLCLIGYASGLGAAAGPTWDWSTGLLLTLLTVFFAYANFVLAGYFKDVSSDRATGYRTVPVVFGLRTASYASDILAATAVALGAAALIVTLPAGLGAEHIAAVLFWTGGIAWALLGQWRLHRVAGEEDAYRAIVPTVHAYILLLAAIAASLRVEWTPLLLALYAGFAIVLSRRPMKEQI